MGRSLVVASWLEVARAAYFEELYRGKNVLWLGTHDPRLVDTLLERGAARVTLLAAGEAQAQLKKRYSAAPVRILSRLAGAPPTSNPAEREMRSGGSGAGAREARRGDEDVAFVSHAEELFRALEAEAAGRMSYVLRKAIVAALRPDGWLIAAAGNADDGDADGLRYFDLSDLVARDFAEVTMAAQVGMAGMTLAPYGQEEAEPRFDGDLMGDARAEVYVAVGGPRRLPLPFGLVALPAEALGRLAPVEVPASVGGKAPSSSPSPEVQALGERLRQSERALVLASEAALRHAEEMRQANSRLAERDAYVAELERANLSVEALRVEAQKQAQRTERVEADERAGRRRIAELEGTIVRLRHGGVPLVSVAPPPEPAPAPPPADDARVAELQAKLDEAEARAQKLQTRAEDLQREAWQHMRGRSEAEAAAAEVREDTVRKLKDARKIANVELMRAMEEAMRKATTLKEELGRAERERKEAVAALTAAREELAVLKRTLEEQARAHVAVVETPVVEEVAPKREGWDG